MIKLKYYAVEGLPTYKDAHMVFKCSGGDKLDYSSSRGQPEWKVDSIYGVQASEKWVEEITEEQAMELHELFMNK
ncbi:MAG: hypothetical protein ACK5KR_08985 [Breznakia sp.]